MIYEHQFGALAKDAGSTVTVAFDFTNDLASGETVVARTVTAVDESGVDVTATIINSSSVTTPYVYVVLVAGTAGETYEIKIVATTSAANLITRYIMVEVMGSVSLNPKLGDFKANSYVNLSEANNYIKNSFYHADQWDKLTFEGRKRVLIQAVGDMHTLNYKDKPYYGNQSLVFPRSDHETYTGTASVNTASKTTLRGLNLYSSTYNNVPSDYFQYGTVHIRKGANVDQTRYISSSTATITGGYGEVEVASPFVNDVVASDQYLIFSPVYQEVKDAQCEQAMYIIEHKLYRYVDYVDVGIGYVRTGDMGVSFKDKAGKHPHKVGLKTKKLLGRHLRKSISVGRA